MTKRKPILQLIYIIPGLPPCCGSGSAGNVVGNIADARTIVNGTLIGKTIVTLFIDVNRINTGDYSFDNSTGTITTDFDMDIGNEYQVTYTS